MLLSYSCPLVASSPPWSHGHHPSATTTVLVPWPPSRGGGGQPSPVPLALPALAFMGGGKMPGEKGLGPAKQAPWHCTMPSPRSSSSGWKGVLLLGFEMVWHGNVIFGSRRRQWIPKPFQSLEYPAKTVG